jgi:hypothetical protein
MFSTSWFELGVVGCCEHRATPLALQAYFWYQIFMAKAIIGTKKKRRGRPKVGAVQVQVRMPPVELAALDAWIKAQRTPRPTRPETIRKLLQIVLSQQPSGKPHKGAAKAKDMAKDFINERLKNLPDEERITRKQRLLKGPAGTS